MLMPTGRRAAAATRDRRVIGIGETGLDYYYDHSDRAVQQDLFRVHIRVARNRAAADHPHARCRGGHLPHPDRGNGEGGLPG
jgi:Tat protein secretion system quality control protein TatD with DNase activity